MDRNLISEFCTRAEGGGSSLTELMDLWLRAGIMRVRVDLISVATFYYDADDGSSMRRTNLLRGVRLRKTPSLSSALQALERNRLDRISYADFVIRIARSGYAGFSIFTKQNIISLEGRSGEHMSLPVLVLPELNEDSGRWR